MDAAIVSKRRGTVQKHRCARQLENSADTMPGIQSKSPFNLHRGSQLGSLIFAVALVRFRRTVAVIQDRGFAANKSSAAWKRRRVEEN